ncbi:MAG TPA: alpha/beta hydrolase-fold protein [Candidatus Obscuribacterales bacterium]
MPVERINFYSETLETETGFLIVRPEQGRGPLPAVLLLRAAPWEWLNPRQDEHRQGRNLLTVIEDLIDKGYCRPLAFILPQTCNDAETAFVASGQALRPDLIADQRGLGNCRIDAFFDQELLPRAFAGGLVADRLAIDGFSLGGAAALYHALRRPERFVSVGSFDGAFLEWRFDNPLLSPETPSDLRFDEFPYLYGFPPDEAAFRHSNVLDLLQRPYSLPPAMIHYAAAEHPTANGWRVRAVLAAGNLHNHAEVPNMHPASQHSWYWADEHLYRTLPFHARHLY